MPTTPTNLPIPAVLLVIFVLSAFRVVVNNDLLSLSPSEETSQQIKQENKHTLKSLQVKMPPFADRLSTILAAAPQRSNISAAQYVYDQVISERLLDEQSPGLSGSITMVAGMWDYRKMDPHADKFMGISFNDDVERFIAGAVSLACPKILFVDMEVYSAIKDLLDEQITHVVIVTLDELAHNLGSLVDTIQTIQHDRHWRAQASWLGNSPQANVIAFQVMGFSKPFLLREAARLNPFHTDSFLWVDGRNECLPQTPLVPQSLGIFNEHFDRFFATYFNYEVLSEVHGFPRSQFIRFTGAPETTTRFKILKGTIFGGKPAHIEVVSLLFEIVLRVVLKTGRNAMGVDECVWAILAYKFPRLFHLFSNDDSCAESTAYDHSCEGYSNGAIQCAVYQWATLGPPSRYPKKI